MTYSDLHDFVVRTIPGAVGTFVYAFTQLGVVAWLTCIWVTVQIVKFSLDWYRAERLRYLQAKAWQDAEDKAEKDYP